MNTSCSCNDILLQIQQIGFLLVDLNLYLDTHPDCKEALSDFSQLTERLHQLKAVYEQQNGPLKSFGHSTVSSDCYWQWVDESTPWPWENKRRCA